MLHALPVRIPAGDAAAVTIHWRDSDSQDAIPTAVRYQVFDVRTSTAVSNVITVDGELASTMTIIVPASALPAGQRSTRALAIQIEAEFNSEQHTTFAYVDVFRVYEFAAA